MGLRPVVLPGIIGLAAGVMNLLPWGGPTARVMTVLHADAGQVFLPLLPAMLAGLLWVILRRVCASACENGAASLLVLTEATPPLPSTPRTDRRSASPECSGSTSS